MLQLLPAILLLMLQGPATLNRGALADRMPDAIRLMVEMRQPDDESGAEPTIEEVNELAEWLRSTGTSIELSTALAHFLGLDANVPSPSSPEIDEPRHLVETIFADPRAAVSLAEATKSHPCRAGPAILAA